MKILMLGFGNVGKTVATLLPRHPRVNAQIVGVVTKSHGAAYHPDGIPPDTVIEAFSHHKGIDPSHSCFSSLDAPAAVESLDYDVLLELTTLSIEDKGEPALSHVRTALRRGKHVVSANKGPIAFAFRELQGLASSSGSHLLFESTVMDGAPVFNMARSSLRGCRVKALTGILNSTTNYVLSQMERGTAMREAVALAQQEGFAEADPRFDLDGWDAAVKISVLWNALGGGAITPDEVGRDGIAAVKPETIARALARSHRLKLIARASRASGRDRASVRLEEVPLTDPFATVTGTGSVLRIETDCMNPILIMQEHPALKDTAYGVINDLLTIVAR